VSTIVAPGSLVGDAELEAIRGIAQAGLPAYLTKKFGVEFHLGTAATRYDRPTLTAGGTTYAADRLVVCSGDDLRTLYPEALQSLGLERYTFRVVSAARPLKGFPLGLPV